MNIAYQEINQEILNTIVAQYGDWIIKYNAITLGDGNFSLAAFDKDTPIGFISAYPETLTYPLSHIKDAFITGLKVDENYQRRGIARHFIECAEEWAKKCGYRQIRSHSDHVSKEAILMWNALKYGMWPVNDWLEDKKIYWAGYNVVKVLVE